MFPGPPWELRPMFQTYATPIIRKIVGHSDLRAMVFRTTGIGESAIQELVGADLATIPAVEVGYCADVGAVDLRLIGTGSAVEQGATIVRDTLDSYIVSADGRPLEEIVVELLTKRNETLAVAESFNEGHPATSD